MLFEKTSKKNQMVLFRRDAALDCAAHVAQVFLTRGHAIINYRTAATKVQTVMEQQTSSQKSD